MNAIEILLDEIDELERDTNGGWSGDGSTLPAWARAMRQQLVEQIGRPWLGPTEWPPRRAFIAWWRDPLLGVLRFKSRIGLYLWRTRRWRDFPNRPDGMVDVTDSVVTLARTLSQQGLDAAAIRATPLWVLVGGGQPPLLALAPSLERQSVPVRAVERDLATALRDLGAGRTQLSLDPLPLDA